MSLPTVAPMEIMHRHPCFDGEAHSRVGRIHLPLAPACNIQCNFCERKVCASMAIQHPGWTAKLISVREAVELVDSIASSRGERNFVVGVAGPGDPLVNDETLAALELIHLRYPEILKCISTNGLLLEEKLPQLLSVGVRALTVTVNAVDSSVGKHIYSWVRYRGTLYHQQEAAHVLLTQQMHGIRKAIEAGLAVKVNTVLIPGINGRHMAKLALKLKESGVRLMNIMPLIPSGRMKGKRAPSCDELQLIRRNCQEIVPQFYHCEQCRADVIYLP